MADYPYLRQNKFTPVDAQVINNAATYTSAAFSLNGVTQLDCYAFIDYAAATKVTFTLYLSDDEDGSEVFQAASAATAAGVTTITKNVVEFTVPGAADQRIQFAFSNLNAMTGKLAVTMASGGNLDAVTVRCIKAVI